MYAVFDRAALLTVLEDFYQLTGLRTVVFDAWGVDILSYPAALPRFCRMIRATPQGEQACRLCDQNACRRAHREGQTVIYPCHAGLIEVICPITVDSTTVGYLLLSHIVQGADREAEWQAVLQRNLDPTLDREALAQAYRLLPCTPYKTLRAAADLLSLAAKSVYAAQLARLVPGSAEEKLNRYLDEHMAEPLGSEMLCRELQCSRTSLYHLAMESYGCGIARHITKLRLRRAAFLLTTTTKSTAEICAETGFADSNYFFRVFKRQMGVTPHTYRAQFSSDASGFGV